MKEIRYEFVDLDSDKSFQSLGESFGGVLKGKALKFDNDMAKGELQKAGPDSGLWIRKWKFTVFQKIRLMKLPPQDSSEKKFLLIYFLNPAIFEVKIKGKKVRVNGQHNSMFLTNNIMVDFGVVPKQPFFLLDIAFTASWLLNHFNDADPRFKEILCSYINNHTDVILTEPCSVEEYKALHELEESMLEDNEDTLFIRSRVYNLVVSFFSKVFNRKAANLVENSVNYEQVVQARRLMLQNLQTAPKISVIAREVNMSVSSLLRQFKFLYGKSIYEYYVEKKMEFAKKMILQNNITVKEISGILGYNQASPFIESFTKYHGYSPGSLKCISY